MDTNIISETIKRTPNEAVISWLRGLDRSCCALSVLTLGEIRKGAQKLIESKKKHMIIQWLESDLLNEFSGRIISINQKVADKWGYISSNNNIPVIDGLIAASALVYNLKLVTRNTKDFMAVPGLELINPWELCVDV